MQRSKKTTKLLLKSCDCTNCNYKICYPDTVSFSPSSLNNEFSALAAFCKNRKKKPKIGICTKWRAIKGYFTGILPLIRSTFPTIVASQIVGIQPMIAPTNKIYHSKS